MIMKFISGSALREIATDFSYHIFLRMGGVPTINCTCLLSSSFCIIFLFCSKLSFKIYLNWIQNTVSLWMAGWWWPVGFKKVLGIIFTQVVVVQRHLQIPIPSQLCSLCSLLNIKPFSQHSTLDLLSVHTSIKNCNLYIYFTFL